MNYNMIKIFLLGLGCLLVATSVTAQEVTEDAYVTDEPRKVYWGFNLGLESGLLLGKASPTDTAMQRFTDASSLPGFGVSVGLSTSIRLSDRWSLKPAVIVSLLPTRIQYARANTGPETPLVYPFTTDIPVHLVLGNPLETNKVSAFAGPAVEFNIPSMEDGRHNTTAYLLRADAGVSIPVNLGLGDSVLDLIYGISLTDVIEGDAVYDQWWSGLQRHRFTVRLHLF